MQNSRIFRNEFYRQAAGLTKGDKRQFYPAFCPDCEEMTLHRTTDKSCKICGKKFKQIDLDLILQTEREP